MRFKKNFSNLNIYIYIYGNDVKIWILFVIMSKCYIYIFNELYVEIKIIIYDLIYKIYKFIVYKYNIMLEFYEDSFFIVCVKKILFYFV